jgi:hypothetical protein
LQEEVFAKNIYKDAGRFARVAHKIMDETY